MAIKKNEIAKGVRVKLNNLFVEKCIGDKYLKEEKVIYIPEQRIYNDSHGDWVHLKGGLNSGYAYLYQLDLEFPYNEE